jgi:hypothetical protein
VTDKATGDKFSPQGAFIFYSPQIKKGKELLFYNEEAWQILAFPVSDSQNGNPPLLMYPPFVESGPWHWKRD